MSIHDETVTVVAAPATDNDRSYIDWPAILAGTFLATAISFVLLTFGSAIGLSMTSAHEGEGVSLFWFAIIGGLWLLWVQISSFMAGGYLTGRMRRRHGDATEYESDIRDGSNGLVMWAVAVLIGAFIAISGVSGAVSTAAQTAGAVGQAAGMVAGEVADAADPNDLLLDRALRGTGQPLDDATRAQVGRVLVNAATEGQLDQADRDFLINVVAQRAGIPPEEAQQRVDQLVAQANEVEAQAREAAEQARRVGMIAAFLAAASLLISGAAAYYAATLGGNHRDKQTVVEGWYRPW